MWIYKSTHNLVLSQEIQCVNICHVIITPVLKWIMNLTKTCYVYLSHNQIHKSNKQTNEHYIIVMNWFRNSKTSGRDLQYLHTKLSTKKSVKSLFLSNKVQENMLFVEFEYSPPALLRDLDIESIQVRDVFTPSGKK